MKGLCPILIFAFSIVISCAPRVHKVKREKVEPKVEEKLPPPREPEKETLKESPSIRIKVAEGDRVFFKPPGRFDVYQEKRKVYEGEKGLWRVGTTDVIKGMKEYYIILSREDSKTEAERKLRSYYFLYDNLEIKEIGRRYLFPNIELDTREYLVLSGPYPSVKDIPYNSTDSPKGTISLYKMVPTGKIQLFKDEKLILEARDYIRVFPPADGPLWFEIIDKNGEEGRYKGVIEFRVSDRGVLVINELPVEEYLKGVVPSEMGYIFPEEALRSQAVVARTEVFAKWRKKLSILAYPYDFPSDVSFQIYTGLTNENLISDKAVYDTRGEVLVYNGKIAHTPYHSNSGGHTESYSMWGEDYPYLQGVWEAEEDIYLDLRREEDVRRWLTTSPDVYSNPDIYPPNSLTSYFRSSFRWKESYSAGELSEIIKRKTGVDIGRLTKIIPLKRGVSGRLLKIRLVGTRRSLSIAGELNIRKTLSRSQLKSSLFVVDVTKGKDGSAQWFTIIGGGYGHGIGMSQVGSYFMAGEGKNYKEILSHYYPGTDILKLY